MKTRRLIVWVIAALFGLAATTITILVFNVSLDKFTTGLIIGDLPLTLFVGYASLAFIWLDYLFRTEYLRS